MTKAIKWIFIFLLLSGINQQVFSASQFAPPTVLANAFTKLFKKYDLPGASIAVVA